jgi:hypothetical protein
VTLIVAMVYCREWAHCFVHVSILVYWFRQSKGQQREPAIEPQLQCEGNEGM